MRFSIASDNVNTDQYYEVNSIRVWYNRSDRAWVITPSYDDATAKIGNTTWDMESIYIYSNKHDAMIEAAKESAIHNAPIVRE